MLLLLEIELKCEDPVCKHLEVLLLKDIQVVQEVELELDVLVGLLLALEKLVDVVG